MKDFDYFTPTRIIFGRDAELKAGALLREQNCKKVLIHYGGGSIVKSGLLDKVRESLTIEGIHWIELGGVVPNPRLANVREGIELCKKEGIDFILAIGGGSVIDSAKAIGYGVANHSDVWDFYSRKRQATACLPIGAILTIPAAGSEMSDASVITNEATGEKRGYSSNLSRCRFAIMNPSLTFSLPPWQTACGCVDIIMHTLERYFTHDAERDLIDCIAEGLMKTIMRNAPIALAEPENYNARAEIMWASSLSHNGITGDRTLGDWACHQLEHELSGAFDVAHGAGLSAIWGSWARYVFMEANALPRFVRLAVNVMNIDNDPHNPTKTALLGIAAMESFFQSIGMPTNISQLGIQLSDDDIARLATGCSFNGARTVGIMKKLDSQDMMRIYAAARE